MVSYLWNTTESTYTTSTITVSTAGNYGVTVWSINGCTGSIFSNLGTELVTDGSFTDFVTASPSFFTQYTQSQPFYDGFNNSSGLMDAGGKYAVNLSAWSNQPQYPTKAIPLNEGYNIYMHGRDHTNNTIGPRNFMMVNGSNDIPRVIWQQTVPVIYQRDYYFSAWAMNLTSSNNARLRFEINGVQVGSILDLSGSPKINNEANIDLSNWDRFYNTSLWTPPSGITQAIIRIINLNTNPAGGNDFGLDDISFGLLASIPDASSASANGGGTVCTGDALNFSVSNLHGGTPPYSYLWTGPNLFNETISNPSIPNAQPVNSGDYTLVVTDANGCTSAPVIKNVVVNSYPVEATSASVDRPDICAGDAGFITLSVPDGNGITLQWFSDDCGVSGPSVGTTTYPVASLTIPAPPSTTSYYARWETACGISSCVPVTVTVASQWTGTLNSNWNNIANWCTGVIPNSSTNVFIPGSGVINYPKVNITNAFCNNLTIQPSATFDINPSQALTVYGDLTNNGTFTINSNALNHNGSLIVNGTSSGIVTYNRYLDNGRWFITSAPVTNTVDFSLSNAVKMYNGTDYDFAPYIEPDNEGWRYYNTTTFPFPSALTPGKGYLAKLKSPNTNIDYTGIINSNVLVPVTNTPTDNGWNAVGNPFTSAIGITSSASSIKKFLFENDAILDPNYKAIYLWYQSGTYTAGVDQYYRVINNSGYFPSGKAYGGPLSDTNYIQAGQGFLINAGVSGNITFLKGSSGMQTHATTLTMKSAETSWPGITLLASNNGRTRSAIVAFNSNMTNGLDPSYDAGILSASDFNVYTHLVDGSNATDFMIQCLPDTWNDTLAVPVGIDLPQAGQLTFKAAGVILPDGLYPVIEDRLLQVSAPLKTETDSLTVEITEPTWGTGRFYLRFGGAISTVGVDNLNESAKLSAYFAYDKIRIFGSPEDGSKAWLYDMSGRKLGGEYRLTSANRNEISAAGLASGIYFLRIEGKTSRQTLKITVLRQ